MHNVVKWPNITLKILRREHRKIFKVCLPILQHYAERVNIRNET